MNTKQYAKEIKEFYALGQIHALDVALFAAKHYSGEELVQRLQLLLAKAQVAREALTEEEAA